MSARYVLADLVRNPRRTCSTMIGVVLGVGLFCGVLFFVDGLSASMTQRAIAPLSIDMQRIVTQRAGADLQLAETVEPMNSRGATVLVSLDLRHGGRTTANEVTVRSVPGPGSSYVAGSARLDGDAIPDAGDNPFSSGPARAGFNLGTLEPGATHELTYRIRSDETAAVSSSVSSRESVRPIAANRPADVGLQELADQIGRLPGVTDAATLSIADLGPEALRAGTERTTGPTKIFGFDDDYARGDDSISIVEGELSADGAVLSAEASGALGLDIGDPVDVMLPDGTVLDLRVTGRADLSRARSLFSSRRGGDLETFVYTANALVVSPRVFSESVFPSFERAAAGSPHRLKSPPIREVDVSIDRNRLDADPAAAAGQTELVAAAVMTVADHQDYLLDNISNTLHVATDDATAAKRLFVFLGVPGALLAAMLSAYAGNVLAEAQRREHAILRIRGASRRHLLRMLAARTVLLTSIGAIVGLTTGYMAAGAILGRASLARASASSLAASAITGTLAGFISTGAALYLTGRRSIDREINEDRAELAVRAPLWRRARLDLAGVAVVVVGTVWAIRTSAFDGTPGSVYFGRSVDLNLRLLALPVSVWVTGSLVAARLTAVVLRRNRPTSAPRFGSVGIGLLRRSVGRRPWAIGNGVIVLSLIVALTTCLGSFTASYDAAKVADARYATGADIRITPSPTASRTYGPTAGSTFETPGIGAITPVIYGLSNVILRSDRTSDPANLAAIDPTSFAAVAPLEPSVSSEFGSLADGRRSILVSADMAAFLHVQTGDTLYVLLARATPDQVEIDLEIAGLYERLPGFPDGADAVIDIALHTASVPAQAPDFFLASTISADERSLDAAVRELRAGPGAVDQLQIDTRSGTLDRDQSSLAALNVAGLVDIDTVFAFGMALVSIAIFVFGLLLQRRREYVTLRAQGLEPRTVRALIAAEAAVVAVFGTITGLIVGAAMGYYFVAILRPLFVLDPVYIVPMRALGWPTLLVITATAASASIGSRVVNGLDPIELLRDE